METDEQFWKIFRLVGSDNEGEALAALRRVKQILKDEGMSWVMFSNAIRNLSDETQSRLLVEAKRRFPGASDEMLKEALRKVFS